MNGSNGLRGALLCAALGAVLASAGCGSDDSANPRDGFSQSGPSTGSGTPSNPGSGTSAAVAVTVSSALPASGNGTVTGSTAASTLVGGTTRSVSAAGTASSASAGTTVEHRFTVQYDTVTGTVLAVQHAWGDAATAGAAACAVVVSPTIPTLCRGVNVDVAASKVTFESTILRGQGAFASILTGTITFPAP
jgi:hypothetical protein